MVAIVRRPASRVLCLAAERLLLLLRWRDPASGVAFWEPPGGGLEPGESWEDAARRELQEETGLAVEEFAGPAMVFRDFEWEGERRVGDEAFFLASWPVVPEVRLESDPALLGFSWVEVAGLGELDLLAPPDVAGVLNRLRQGPPSRRSR